MNYYSPENGGGKQGGKLLRQIMLQSSTLLGRKETPLIQLMCTNVVDTKGGQWKEKKLPLASIQLLDCALSPFHITPTAHVVLFVPLIKPQIHIRGRRCRECCRPASCATF